MGAAIVSRHYTVVKHIPENIHILVRKYFNGTITPEEKKELDAWYHSLSPQETEIISDATEDEIRLLVKERLDRQVLKERTALYFNRRFLVGAAAVLLLCASTGAVYFLLSQKKKNDKTIVIKEPARNEIVPGGNKAILTLGDGTAITLDSANNGDLGQQGDSKIIKTADGQLEYQAKKLVAIQYPVVYNTVSTPRGGQYRIELADGTAAWLNASSSIRFPVAFSDSLREVQITGEVYFEVAKNPAKPFRVKVKDNYINVLGTHFNVMAYDNETAINTTLLEGSLKVTNDKNAILLKPGENAMANGSGTIIVHKEDSPEDAIAWVRGKFLFHSADIKNIMRQVERWYDVDVSFEKDINLHFTGELNRSDNVSGLLRKLELTGEVHFKIEKKKITVLP